MSYATTKGVNWSSLKYLVPELGGSPLLYRYRQRHPEPRKDAYVVGGATHCATLEPRKYKRRYGVYPGTRRGKAWDQWQADHPGVQSLKPHERATAMGMARAVLTRPSARLLVRGGRAEVPLTWTDAETGVLCKGRLDYLLPRRVADLKTARSIDPRKWGRACAEYCYHGQMAFYHDGAIAARALPPDAPLPVMIAVQSSPPYDVAIYELTQAQVDAGREIYRRALRLLQTCIDTDHWPGAVPEIQTLELPTWAPGMWPEEDEL